MSESTEAQNLMEDIDARQNDVLARLDELNAQIESLLNEIRPPVPAEPEAVEDLTEPSVAAAPQLNPGDPADPISQLPAAA